MFSHQRADQSQCRTQSTSKCRDRAPKTHNQREEPAIAPRVNSSSARTKYTIYKGAICVCVYVCVRAVGVNPNLSVFSCFGRAHTALFVHSWDIYDGRPRIIRLPPPCEIAIPPRTIPPSLYIYSQARARTNCTNQLWVLCARRRFAARSVEWKAITRPIPQYSHPVRTISPYTRTNPI